MALDDIDKRLIQDYIKRLLEHLVEDEEIHPEVAAGLVRTHFNLIQDSYEHCFPEEFCAKRINVANWKNMNKGEPSAGFQHDLHDPDSSDDEDDTSNPPA